MNKTSHSLVGHRAWSVFIGCLIVQGMTIGVSINCFGVLSTAICADQSFSVGDFSWVNTVRSLVAAVALPFLSHLMHRRFVRYLRITSLAMLLLMFGSLIAATTYTQVYQWYITAVLLGLGTSIFLVNQVYIITNWFERNTALFIGIAGAASGLAGMLLNPVVSVMIQSYGWQRTLMGMSLAAIALGSIGCYQFVFSPKEIHLQPYGHEDVAHAGQAQPISNGKIIGRPGAVMFYLVGFVFWANSCISGFILHLPTYATEMRLPLQTGALFASCVMLGNIVGKVALGFLCDRFDYRSVFRTTLMMISAACAAMALLTENQLILLVSCAIIGMSQSVYVVLTHLLVRDIYRRERYLAVFARLQLYTTLLSAPVFTLVGYIYDAVGSYQPSLLAGSGIMMAAVVCLSAIFRRQKRSTEFGECFSQIRQPL